MRLEITTPPAVALISTSDIKAYLNVSMDSDDKLIKSLLDQATGIIETRLNKSLREVAYTLWLDYADITDGGYLSLPNAPVKTITSITWYDSEDAAHVLTTDDYVFVSGDNRVEIIKDITGPFRGLNTVKVVYVSGWTNIPSGILQAIKELVAHLYDNRGETDIPTKIKEIINPFK